MPHDPVTATVMASLIAMSLGGLTLAWRRMRLGGRPAANRIERALAAAIVLLAFGALAYRCLAVHGTWAPLQSHADGVLLIVGLVGSVVLYVELVGRLRGFELFGLPLMAVLSGWGLCASWWTFDQSQFPIRGVWHEMHITLVYLGMTAVAMTAVTGGLYLFVQRQLKRKDDPAARIRLLGRTASLETIDRWLLRWSSVAFVLLTLIIAVGVIDASISRTSLGSHWWTQPKVIVALAAWLVFAVLCHVRFTPALRGRRAAMISVAGLAIVLAVVAMSIAGSHARPDGAGPPAPPRAQDP